MKGALQEALAWAVTIVVAGSVIGLYFYLQARDQVTSPAHQFVVACRAVDGTPFQSADGTLSCFSAPGAGKDRK